MFKPMNGNVVLDWYKEEETVSEFGIVIPNSKSKRGDIATVLAVSEGSELQVGWQVVFNKLAGKFTKIDGDEVLIIPESEIYAVVEE